jgi:LacI family transcriptional regulator
VTLPDSRRPRAPTILDVAAHARVSKSTVSNVVRGSDGVAEETRRRVQEAIATLGYRPNALARQFVRQRTTILGVLVGDLENPFYAEMAKGVERYAFERGYTAMLCNIEGSPDFAVSRVEALVEQHVAGLVFLALFGGVDRIRAALDPATPAVFAGLREDWADSVSVSDRAGAKLAMQHLVDLGHERIAYLTSSHVEERASRGRHAGAQSVLRAAGLSGGPAVYWDGEGEVARVGGRPVTLLSLFKGRERHTAVLCSNDLQAIALLEFADRQSLRVPEDLAVVGFDDIHLAGLARISLSTVRQPIDALAAAAVDTVVGRLEGRTTGPATHRSLEPSLVVRGSTVARAA